jgi:hypothetical protein
MLKILINFILILIFILLGFGCLLKYHVISIYSLETHDKLVSEIKELVEIIVIIAGAIFSYFRFFHEFTFTEKGDIEFEVSLIETPHGTILHHLTISIINKGSTRIWAPTAEIGIQAMVTGSENAPEIIKGIHLKKSYFDDSLSKSRILFDVVDTGEQEDFIIQREFSKSVWAVLYEAEITSEEKSRWKKTILVENKIKEKNS